MKQNLAYKIGFQDGVNSVMEQLPDIEDLIWLVELGMELGRKEKGGQMSKLNPEYTFDEVFEMFVNR